METEKIKGVRTSLQHAETIRRYLSENNILRTDLKIYRNKLYICFPVKNIANILHRETITIEERDFEKQIKKPKTYKDLLHLPEALQSDLPTSYDIIGDILLIKIPKTLQNHKQEIGEALRATHKNIHVVCSIEAVKGEIRTRDLEIIAGEKRTTTTHVEYGLVFDVDVQKTYFSPRLATERRRIASLVKPGEIIVDMFAGVAPFSIMIARNAQPRMVYALDKNEEAIRYAKQNIKKNRVLDNVEAFHADAKDAPRIFCQKKVRADRIIMNLPFSAFMFFSSALQIAAEQCTIHYYDILKEESIQERIEYLNKIAKKHRIMVSFSSVRKIKTYAPREFYIGIDIKAQKTPM